MTPLSKEDSWSLFCVHAFSSPSNVRSELKVLAESMAEQCKGLPLALKVIGSAMIGKTLPELQWEPVLKKLSESHMGERTVEQVLYDPLKLGYDLLSEDDPRLKDCFLYFAAFPEDSRISFNNILWHWIVEGLVPKNGRDNPKAEAFSLLSKLLERSLIESIGEIDSDGQWFSLHDVMRDMAFYIVENGKTPAEDNLYRAGQNLETFPQEWKATSIQPSKARRLSLHVNNLKTLPESFCAPDLVSLLLGENRIVSIPATFLRSFPKLRVLDLSFGEFDSIPEELGDLEDLVCLNLSDCFNLQILPKAVGKLHALKYLNLSKCEKLKYLSSGIVGLTSLQVLHLTDCENLKSAKQTSSCMARAESLDPSTEASLKDIGGLGSLTELSIFGAPHNISALTKLKFLHLRLPGVKTLPAKMAYWFKQLETLKLWSGTFETLPSSFTSPGAFPALVRFEIFNCSYFVELPKVEEGALPKLRTLQFYSCDSLTILPLFGAPDQLEKIEFVGLYGHTKRLL